jgi:hypothetical protein
VAAVLISSPTVAAEPPAAAADETPFVLEPLADRNGEGFTRLAHGMCGGRWGGWMEGRCGGMMGGMMMGRRAPPAAAAGSARPPEPASEGATLMNEYCTQCHSLPRPEQHTASGWPPVLQRMATRMQWIAQNSTMPIAVPSRPELQAITEYLQKHAAKRR